MIYYEYDSKSNVIHSYPEGIIKTKDVLAYLRKLHVDDSILPLSVEKVDFTKMRDLKLKFSDTLQMRREYNLVKKKRKISKTIFMVNNDLTFGIARMLQTVCSEINHAVQIERVGE